MNPLSKLAIGLTSLTVVTLGALTLPTLAQSGQPEGEAGKPALAVLEGGPTGQGFDCQGLAVVCQDKIAFGISTPDALSLGKKYTTLESKVGGKSTLVSTYQDFTEPFYVDKMNKVAANNKATLLTWEPLLSTNPTRNAFPLEKIAEGHFDSYINARAKEAKKVKGEFIIRFGHEMNGFWYPWGQPRTLHPQNIASPDNTPEKYVAAYRHVVKLFRDAGVTNVAWMWGPNLVDGNPSVTLESLYPGHDYVDVVGLSGYYLKATDNFPSRYRNTLEQIEAVAPSKPLMVAEMGVTNVPNRPELLKEFVQSLTDTPRLTGFVYFSQPDSSGDFIIDSDAPAQAALSTALEEARVETPITAFALAQSPLIDGFSGTPLTGDTLKASYSWKGFAEVSTSAWWTCSQQVFDRESCTFLAYGGQHKLTLAERGKYLFNVFGTAGLDGTDEAVSLPVGPVRQNPPAVSVSSIDMLASAVRINLPAAPAGLTNWIITHNGETKYMPTTTREIYLNSLVQGSKQKLEVSVCDCPQRGPVASYEFTVMTRPADFTVQANGVLRLPEPLPGQTGWVVKVGSLAHEIDLNSSTFSLPGLAVGSNRIHLARVSQDALTSFTEKGFNYNPTH